MKVYLDWPPNIEEIAAAFPHARSEWGVIFTYGDVIYNPHNVEISPELIAHEGVHCSRQGVDEIEVKAWWKRYIEDPVFRLAEELPAHRAEYKRFCQRHRDGNERSRYLRVTATRLSSPLYGSLISEIEARQRISA